MRKPFKVIYTASTDEENFTFGTSYLALNSREGVLTVLCDSAELIEMTENDFISENQPTNQQLIEVSV